MTLASMREREVVEAVWAGDIRGQAGDVGHNRRIWGAEGAPQGRATNVDKIFSGR